MPNLMPSALPSIRRPTALAALAVFTASMACLALLTAPAMAEKADRDKPMVVRADKDGVWDMQRQVIVFSGNVTLTQGTMQLAAERVEVRELPDGYRHATLTGSARSLASYRQKRDAVDEFVEGQAERIEYDGRADVLKFQGRSVVRRLRGTTVADEITGSSIVWDNTRELFSVSSDKPGAADADGRVRAILGPRPKAASDATPPPSERAPGSSR